jgi:7,8-dihydropterin-6-yl-methyl-4-(beta-D-ribofuranosyl)aminobenzene 5'-phosphate synthase
VLSLVLLAAGPVPKVMGEKMVELRIAYDNRTFRDGFEPDWGFACVVDIGERRLLFDTGAKGGILTANLRALDIEPASIDVVVISHDHWDHTGGLEMILEAAPVECYIPGSAAGELGQKIKAGGGSPVSVRDRIELFPGVWSTGELGEDIREQALVVESRAGPVVLTGCAHPGIVDIVERVKEQFGKPPCLVLGGFHLCHTQAADVEQVIDKLKQLGVTKVGPAHCTGDEAIALFQERWREGFVRIGCGWSTEMELQ